VFVQSFVFSVPQLQKCLITKEPKMSVFENLVLFVIVPV